MMKLDFKTTLLLFIFSTTINAQFKKLHRDSIVYYFKNNEPIIASKKINEKLLKGYIIDYKSLYNDNEIKRYFLECLNRKRCGELEINEYITEYRKNNLDIDYFKYSLKSYINDTKRKINIDSIFASKSLIDIYRDTIINHRYEFLKKDLKTSYKGCIPNLNTLVKLKYREVYDTIKKWNIDNSSLDLFDELLKFNDPDAVKIFDKKVENYVKSNGEKDHYANLKKSRYDSFIRESNTSFTFSKLTELIKIHKTNVYFYGHIISKDGNMQSEDSYMNENFYLLDRTGFFDLILKYELPYHGLIKARRNIEINDLQKEKKFMKDNYKEIIKAILDISNKMKEEEEYWMVNMPFYKKK
ncbi:hypothetical protein V3Q90_15835 [Flavobacterium oreochromis]|uniref:hypothetical protein n=1 Tax=Flavobacterium oreochromis TaxID=2906078 RepID=UPI00385D0006